MKEYLEMGKLLDIGTNRESVNSQAIFDGFITGSPIGLYIIQDNKFQYVNPRFEEILGYNSDELVGTDPLQYVYPEDRESVNNNAIKMLKVDAGHQPYKFRVVSKSGNIRWVMETVAPIIYKGKRANAGNFMDITEQEEAKKASREGEKKYKELFDNIGSCVAVYEAVDEGNDFIIKDFNKTAQRVEQIVKEKVLGKLLTEVFPGVRDFGLLDVLQHVWRTGQTEHLPVAFYKDCRISGWRDNYVYKLPSGEIVVAYEDVSSRIKLELEMGKNTQFLQTLLDSLPVPVFYKSANGVYLGCNSKFDDFLGTEREKFIGKTAYDISPKELADIYTNKDHELIENPGIRVYDTQVRSSSGKLRDVVFYKATFPGDEDKIGGIISTVLDITDRRQAEEQLRLQAQLLDAATESVYLREYDGQLVYVNEAAANMLGYTRAELLRMNINSLIPTEEIPALSGRHHSIKAHNNVNFEATCIHKNGVRVPVDINAKEIEWGDRKLVLVVARDISLRIQAEKALQESEERLREAQTLGKIANYEIDMVTNNVAWSDEMYVLFERDKKLAPPDFDEIPTYFSAEEFARYAALSENTAESGKQVNADIIAKLPSGNTPVFHISINPVKDTTGKVKKLFGTIQDITELKQAEAKLSKSYVQLQQAFSGITRAMAAAVELRDPYTAGHQVRVAGLARMIAREMNLAEDHVNRIYTAGLIHDIGKISIPADILVKPGKLSDLEYSIIKMHVQAGFNILKNIEFPYPLAQWILEHHERMDGSGYPLGISGPSISLEARIIAVADVVEGMSTHRPYRPSLGLESALDEVSKNKSILYDPAVVDVCLKLFKKGFKFE
jgi:PAS domain S-box-containing protein/putative nucleotidyltransferase with HDIG domain